jgi:hypothetical protein
MPYAPGEQPAAAVAGPGSPGYITAHRAHKAGKLIRVIKRNGMIDQLPARARTPDDVRAGV